jgi:hypothetical protein
MCKRKEWGGKGSDSPYCLLGEDRQEGLYMRIQSSINKYSTKDERDEEWWEEKKRVRRQTHAATMTKKSGVRVRKCLSNRFYVRDSGRIVDGYGKMVWRETSTKSAKEGNGKWEKNTEWRVGDLKRKENETTRTYDKRA